MAALDEVASGDAKINGEGVTVIGRPWMGPALAIAEKSVDGVEVEEDIPEMKKGGDRTFDDIVDDIARMSPSGGNDTSKQSLTSDTRYLTSAEAHSNGPLPIDSDGHGETHRAHEYISNRCQLMDVSLDSLMDTYNTEVEDFSTEKLLAGKARWVESAHNIVDMWEALIALGMFWSKRRDIAAEEDVNGGVAFNLYAKIDDIKASIAEVETPDSYPSALAALLEKMVVFATAWVAWRSEECLESIDDMGLGNRIFYKYLDNDDSMSEEEEYQQDVHQDENEESDESMEYIPPSVPDALGIHEIVLDGSSIRSASISQPKDFEVTDTESNKDAFKLNLRLSMIESDMEQSNNDANNNMAKLFEKLEIVEKQVEASAFNKEALTSLCIGIEDQSAHINTILKLINGDPSNQVRSDETNGTDEITLDAAKAMGFLNLNLSTRKYVHEQTKIAASAIEQTTSVWKSDIESVTSRVQKMEENILQLADQFKTLTKLSERNNAATLDLLKQQSENMKSDQKANTSTPPTDKVDSSALLTLKQHAANLAADNELLRAELHADRKRFEMLVELLFSRDEEDNTIIETGSDDGMDFLWPQGYPAQAKWKVLGYVESEQKISEVEVPGAVSWGRGKPSPGFCSVM